MFKNFLIKFCKKSYYLYSKFSFLLLKNNKQNYNNKNIVIFKNFLLNYRRVYSIISLVEKNKSTNLQMVKMPGMYDSPIYLEPTFTLKGFLYDLPDVRPPRISGRQNADCGYPPSFARSLNCRKRHFGLFKLHKIWKPLHRSGFFYIKDI